MEVFSLKIYSLVSFPFSHACYSLSELETDIKMFKDSMLKVLDEDETVEEFCLTKWTDPRVLYVTHALTHVYGCWTQYLKNSWKSPVSGEACWKRKTRICWVAKDQSLFPVCFHSPADHTLQVNLFLCMWVFVLFFQIKLILPKLPGPAVLLFFIHLSILFNLCASILYITSCLSAFLVKRAVWVLTTLRRWSFYWRIIICR